MPHIVVNLPCNPIPLSESRCIDLVILIFQNTLVLLTKQQILLHTVIPDSAKLLIQQVIFHGLILEQARNHTAHCSKTHRRPLRGHIKRNGKAADSHSQYIIALIQYITTVTCPASCLSL